MEGRGFEANCASSWVSFEAFSMSVFGTGEDRRWILDFVRVGGEGESRFMDIGKVEKWWRVREWLTFVLQ